MASVHICAQTYLLETATSVAARSSSATVSWLPNSRPVMNVLSLSLSGSPLHTSIFVPVFAHHRLDRNTIKFVCDALNEHRGRVHIICTRRQRGIGQRKERIRNEDHGRIVEMHLVQCLDISRAIRELSIRQRHTVSERQFQKK